MENEASRRSGDSTTTREERRVVFSNPDYWPRAPRYQEHLLPSVSNHSRVCISDIGEVPGLLRNAWAIGPMMAVPSSSFSPSLQCRARVNVRPFHSCQQLPNFQHRFTTESPCWYERGEQNNLARQGKRTPCVLLSELYNPPTTLNPTKHHRDAKPHLF